MPSGSASLHATGSFSDDDVGRAIGQELRVARQRSGADLYDIADTLRIKPSYLFALENGDLGDLPGLPYALGFLRSYADHLGLDGQKLVRRLKAGEPAAGQRSELAYPVHVREEGRPYGLVALALMVLAGAGYGGWTFVAGQVDPEVDLVAEAPFDAPTAVPSTPDPEIAAAADSSSTPLDPPPVAPATTGTSVPGAVDLAGAAPPSGDTVADAGISTAPAGGVVADNVLPVQDAAPVSPAAVDEGRPNPGIGAAIASEARVVLIASETAWIQVRSADRQFSRSRLMEQGERFPLPERTDLALWTGNAGGLQVMVDGTELAPLGPRGAVLKNVPLDPAGLKARFSPQ